jgi:hypothetical protein
VCGDARDHLHEIGDREIESERQEVKETGSKRDRKYMGLNHVGWESDTDNSRRHTVSHRIKIAINKLKYLAKLFWKSKGGMCMCWLE